MERWQKDQANACDFFNQVERGGPGACDCEPRPLSFDFVYTEVKSQKSPVTEPQVWAEYQKYKARGELPMRIVNTRGTFTGPAFELADSLGIELWEP